MGLTPSYDAWKTTPPDPLSDRDAEKMSLLGRLAEIANVRLDRPLPEYIGEFPRSPVVSIVLDDLDEAFLPEEILLGALSALAEVAKIAGRIDEATTARIRRLLLVIDGCGGYGHWPRQIANGEVPPAPAAKQPTLGDLDLACAARARRTGCTSSWNLERSHNMHGDTEWSSKWLIHCYDRPLGILVLKEVATIDQAIAFFERDLHPLDREPSVAKFTGFAPAEVRP